MVRRLLVYMLVLAASVAAIIAVLRVGSRMTAPTTAAVATTTAVPGAPALAQPLARLHEPLPLLLLQVVAIVATARLFGALFQRHGQPAVIGEMLAGILLGPSLLGWLWPASQAFLFPAASLAALRMLSQIGVILFMFVVGIDVDVAHLRRRAHAAVWVSHTSILAPMLLGTSFALLVYPSLAAPGTSFTAFALFMGVAMSITAFPVLARILAERGLAATPLGAAAIACAAVDDVSAWCLLALVVTLAKSQAVAGAGLTALLTLAFVALLLGVVRPLAARTVPAEPGDESRAKAILAGALAFLFLCALATETIGIHALFGAFLAGVAMPRTPTVRVYLRQRLEAFASVFLLPLFFAFTGLRTQVGLLRGGTSWLLFAGVLMVAVGGKLGGSMLAARATGMAWPDSFALGALMNTRGLIELVVLDLGYELGILPPTIFAMMVLMALITTAMTGPLLDLARAWTARAAAPTPAAPSPSRPPTPSSR